MAHLDQSTVEARDEDRSEGAGYEENSVHSQQTCGFGAPRGQHNGEDAAQFAEEAAIDGDTLLLGAGGFLLRDDGLERLIIDYRVA